VEDLAVTTESPLHRQEPPIEEQRRFWNARARTPEPLNPWTRLCGEATLSMLGQLSLQRPHIIDLGCGTGWLTEQLAAHGVVSGIDLSDECIEQARQRTPHVEYIAGDLFNTPLPQGQYDVVVSQDVVAHVTDQPGYIALAARLLRPSGHLIITTTSRDVEERMDLPPPPIEHIIERWLSMRSLSRLLRTHFTVVRTATVMPTGSRGAPRLVYAGRLKSMKAPWITHARQVKLKEKPGSCCAVIALACKRGDIKLPH
jgi:SAM-dependent methyltransferase